MSGTGVRHSGELQVQIYGEKERGQVYLPAARLLMGKVLADAQVNQLGRHQMRQVLDDGTVLVADKIGAINRVQIVPAGGGPPRLPLKPLDDVVVWARDAPRPDGIDVEHPQQVLRAYAAGQGRAWETYFFDTDTPGYQGFPGRKSTYGGRFPEGLRRAGNVDWVSEDRERISWYGPQCRYFYDGYVQPRSQYGKFVFMMGQVLLDTDQYAIESPEQAHGADRYVLGAALRKVDGVPWLYVVLSQAPDVPLPTGEEPAGAQRYSQPYAPLDVPSTMYRYRLLVEVDPMGVAWYRVSPNSREGLIQVTNLSAEPWIFNTSCTEARCWEMPSGSGWFAVIADRENVQPGDVVEQFPTTSQTLHVVSITDDAVFHASQALSASDNGVGVAIASDWVKDERRDLLLVVQPGVVPYLRMGQLDVLLNDCVVGPDSVNRLERRYLMFADLRAGVLVFMRSHAAYLNGNTNQPNLGEGISIEIYHGAGKVFDSTPDPTTLHVPLVRSLIESSRKYGSLAGRAINPFFWLYGLCLLKAKPEDEAPGLTDVNPDFAGACNAYGCLPMPAAAYFGAYHIRHVDDMPVQTVGQRARPGFSANRADFDQHYSMLGCAANEEVVVLSMHNPMWHEADPQFADRSLSFVTGTSLGALTGVAGALSRYHPIWQIGEPPKPLP